MLVGVTSLMKPSLNNNPLAREVLMLEGHMTMVDDDDVMVRTTAIVAIVDDGVKTTTIALRRTIVCARPLSHDRTPLPKQDVMNLACQSN